MVYSKVKMVSRLLQKQENQNKLIDNEIKTGLYEKLLTGKGMGQSNVIVHLKWTNTQYFKCFYLDWHLDQILFALPLRCS